MRIEGAIFDLDGTLTDSMYIWNEAPKALVRKFGGEPPEDLARDIREMGRREASEYMVDTFCLPCTPEQVMEGVNALVTGEYRDRVPMKTGADTLLERLGALRVPCGIATASEAFQARDAMVRLGTSCSPSVPFSTGLRPDRTSIGLLPAAWAARRSARWSLRMPSMPHAAPNGRAFWWRGCMTPPPRRIRRHCGASATGISPGWTPRISWQHWSGAEPGMERVRPGEEEQGSAVRDGRQAVPNRAKMGRP